MSTATLSPALFDEDTFTGSGPRARKGDRIQSHLAADRSQRSMHATKRSILQLLADRGPLPGSEINLALRKPGPGFDTPRKRAGELAADGYLTFRLQTSDGNHLPEAVYSLTARGREAIR